MTSDTLTTFYDFQVFLESCILDARALLVAVRCFGVHWPKFAPEPELRLPENC